MEFISYYLGMHNEIKEVLYVFDNDTNKEALLEVLKIRTYDRFTVMFDEINVDDVFKNELVNLGVDFDISDNYVYGAVVIGSNSKLPSASLSKYSKNIVAAFKKDVDVFTYWENSRLDYKHIIFAKKKSDDDNEVLDWEYKENTPELSVILPVYNVENYLQKCIDSLIEWKADYVEYVFVSDGSPDNSVALIKEAQKKDSRIKLLEKENGGCASARQFGIDNTKGKYIGLIDPDDFIDPSMFKKLLSRALGGNYDISYCGYKQFIEGTDNFVDVPDLLGKPFNNGITIRELIYDLVGLRRIGIWRSIYKRQLLEDNNIKFHSELKRFDDLPFKVETLACCKSIISLEEYLYNYRLGRSGQDVSATDSRLFVHFDIFKILDEFMSKFSDPHLLEMYELVKINTHCWALSIIESKYFYEYFENAMSDLKLDNGDRFIAKVKGIIEKEQLEIIKKKINEFEGLLSVIIPVYNINDLSVFSCLINKLQTQNVEIIVIDDGSEKPVELNNVYKNVKIIKTEHIGVSEARNLGLSVAKNKYVWFVDSDDAVNDCYYNLLSILKNCNSQILYLKAENGLGNLICTENKDKNALKNYLLSITDDPYLWNKIYAVKFLKKNKICFNKKIAYGEDAVFNFKAALKAKKIEFFDLIPYRYNLSPTSSIHSCDKKTLFSNHQMIIDEILKVTPRSTLKKYINEFKNYFDLLIDNAASNEIEAQSAKTKYNKMLREK